MEVVATTTSTTTSTTTANNLNTTSSSSVNAASSTTTDQSSILNNLTNSNLNNADSVGGGDVAAIKKSFQVVNSTAKDNGTSYLNGNGLNGTKTNCIPSNATNNVSNNDSLVDILPYSRTLTYYRTSGRPRKTGNYNFKEENIKSYTDANGVVYKVSDHVYMDINKPNQPFAIACVMDFKTTKRDMYMIEVRRYYRPNELPDGVYLPLMQDRLMEHKNSANELIVLEPIIKGRELFASDCRDIYPSSFIKGRCRVFHYQDILEAKYFKPFADTFFSILTYNPDARRLANTQGEIRVGASHQALMPECQPIKTPSPSLDKQSAENGDANSNENWETVLWKSKQISDANLLTYLQAARSIAAFAGMCDRGNTEDMYDAAQSDSTTIYAMDKLHEMNYDTAKALQSLVKNPIPKMLENKKWSEEDQKKFIKGLKNYGKHFDIIRNELLPHKETTEIVEYYYLWKKTPAAASLNNIPRRRIRPMSAIKKASSNANGGGNTNGKSNGGTNTPTPSNSKKSNNLINNEQYSGGSDIDSDNESDESSDNKQASSNQTCCTNCFTTSSKDWQNGGLEGQLLCYDCRMYYKKYGELPQINLSNMSSNLVNVKSTKSTASSNETSKSNGVINELKTNESSTNNNDSTTSTQTSTATSTSVNTTLTNTPSKNKNKPTNKNDADASNANITITNNNNSSYNYDDEDDEQNNQNNDSNNTNGNNSSNDENYDEYDQEVDEINSKTEPNFKEDNISVNNEKMNISLVSSASTTTTKDRDSKMTNQRPESAVQATNTNTDEASENNKFKVINENNNMASSNEPEPANNKTNSKALLNLSNCSIGSSTSSRQNDDSKINKQSQSTTSNANRTCSTPTAFNKNNLGGAPIMPSPNTKSSRLTPSLMSSRPDSQPQPLGNLNISSSTPTLAQTPPPPSSSIPPIYPLNSPHHSNSSSNFHRNSPAPSGSQNQSINNNNFGFMPPNLQPAMIAAAFQQIFQQNPQNMLLNPEQLQQQLQIHFQQQLAQQQQSSNSNCSSPAPKSMPENDPSNLLPPIPINIIINKSADMIKADSNAMFVRVWDRGLNSCARTDLHFKYLPNAKYLKTKQEMLAQKKEAANNTNGTAQSAKPSSGSNNSPSNVNNKKNQPESGSFKQVQNNTKDSLIPNGLMPNQFNNFMGNFPPIPPHPPSHANSNNSKTPTSNVQNKAQQQQQQQAQSIFDQSSALKQLRDIADRSNPLFNQNQQNQSNHQQLLFNEFNKLFQNSLENMQQTQPQQQQQQQQQQKPSKQSSNSPSLHNNDASLAQNLLNLSNGSQNKNSSFSPISSNNKQMQSAFYAPPPPPASISASKNNLMNSPHHQNQNNQSLPPDANAFLSQLLPQFQQKLANDLIMNSASGGQLPPSLLPPGINANFFNQLERQMLEQQQIQQQQQQMQQQQINNNKMTNGSKDLNKSINNSGMSKTNANKSVNKADNQLNKSNEKSNPKTNSNNKNSNHNNGNMKHVPSSPQLNQMMDVHAKFAAQSHSPLPPNPFGNMLLHQQQSQPTRPSSQQSPFQPQQQKPPSMSSPSIQNQQQQQQQLEHQQLLMAQQQQQAAAALLFRNNPQAAALMMNAAAAAEQQNNPTAQNMLLQKQMSKFASEGLLGPNGNPNQMAHQFQNILQQQQQQQQLNNHAMQSPTLQNSNKMFLDELSPAANMIRAQQQQQMMQQQHLFAQNEEMKRLEQIERERQIRMFTAAMSGQGGFNGIPGLPPPNPFNNMGMPFPGFDQNPNNEELFRQHLQQLQHFQNEQKR